MPYLGITMHRGAGQVVEEAARLAAWVAVLIEAPVGVGVDADQTAGAGVGEGNGLDGRDGPGGGEVPAGAVCVVVDEVGHGPVRGDAVGPLVAAVVEEGSAGERIPAVGGVGEVGERSRELEGDLAVRGDADRLIAEPLARFPVRLQEP